MIAVAKPIRREKSPPAWHCGFLAMLPQIRTQARVAFRAAKQEAKEELITEVVANAFCAYARLVERGKADLAYATPLAMFAICQVRAGRRVGAKLTVRDISSPRAQMIKGITLERIDKFNREEGEWREVLIEDRKAGPAETAAARIDVPAWFRSLTCRDRRIAQALARGESTREVAKMFGLTAGRVSQLRQEFKQSWDAFHGDLNAA